MGDKGQVFTSNGTFTIPAGVTAVKVSVYGGSGNGTAGGDYSCFGGGSGGSGGNAGGVAYKWLTNLTPSATLTVVVGGIAANSTVSAGTQSLPSGTITAGGNGGAVTNGDINIVGGLGGSGDGQKASSNGGIGGAGGNGGIGGGGGGGGAQGASGGVGGSGSIGISGNKGSNASSVAGGAGGAGKAGIVIFEW